MTERLAEMDNQEIWVQKDRKVERDFQDGKD